MFYIYVLYTHTNTFFHVSTKYHIVSIIIIMDSLDHSRGERTAQGRFDS